MKGNLLTPANDIKLKFYDSDPSLILRRLLFPTHFTSIIMPLRCLYIKFNQNLWNFAEWKNHVNLWRISACPLYGTKRQQKKRIHSLKFIFPFFFGGELFFLFLKKRRNFFYLPLVLANRCCVSISCGRERFFFSHSVSTLSTWKGKGQLRYIASPRYSSDNVQAKG